MKGIVKESTLEKKSSIQYIQRKEEDLEKETANGQKRQKGDEMRDLAKKRTYDVSFQKTLKSVRDPRDKIGHVVLGRRREDSCTGGLF